MKKFFALFGAAAAIAYVLAVMIGGALLEGYSHTYNTISELTASNVTVPPVVNILFASYNIFLMIFGIGAYLFAEPGRKKRMKAASILLVLVGLVGAAMYFFPQDPRHAPMTFGGKMHIALASVVSLLTMLSMLLAAMSFKESKMLKGLRAYSFVSLAFVFTTGGIAAASVAQDASLGGLFERFTIGGFIQWVFVVSLCTCVGSIYSRRQSATR